MCLLNCVALIFVICFRVIAAVIVVDFKTPEAFDYGHWRCLVRCLSETLPYFQNATSLIGPGAPSPSGSSGRIRGEVTQTQNTLIWTEVKHRSMLTCMLVRARTRSITSLYFLLLCSLVKTEVAAQPSRVNHYCSAGKFSRPPMDVLCCW